MTILNLASLFSDIKKVKKTNNLFESTYVLLTVRHFPLLLMFTNEDKSGPRQTYFIFYMYRRMPGVYFWP